MSLDNKYPAISDLRTKASRRIPHFMWEYLDSATGTEEGMHRNRAFLDDIRFLPQVLKGDVEYDLTTTFLGKDYALPFGIAPVGMSGAMWPGAEHMLARLAVREKIPFCLSTMATRTPEHVADEVGDQGWFQLYPPGDMDILDDMLKRIRTAGFHTLVLTVDVPTQSRRERQTRAGLTHPPSITARTLWHIAQRPAWALGTARMGMPKMPFIGKYSTHKGPLPSTAHIGYLLRVPPDWDYVRRLREKWKGPLVLKGILDPADAVLSQKEGVDSVWVSDHAARQFDGGPSAIHQLAKVRAAVGPDYPLIFCSGISGGLDVLRALAMGADFVMLGKAFHYGLGALGEKGAAHVVHILREDLLANMGQMCIAKPTEATSRLISGVR